MLTRAATTATGAATAWALRSAWASSAAQPWARRLRRPLTRPVPASAAGHRCLGLCPLDLRPRVLKMAQGWFNVSTLEQLGIAVSDAPHATQQPPDAVLAGGCVFQATEPRFERTGRLAAVFKLPCRKRRSSHPHS